jgi:hypothetical protein
VGKKDIHALSAMSIRDVKIRKSKEKPVIVEISMYNESGIFQVDQLLKKKIAGTLIERYIEVVAQVEKEQRKVILSRYTLGTGVEIPATAEIATNTDILSSDKRTAWTTGRVRQAQQSEQS